MGNNLHSKIGVRLLALTLVVAGSVVSLAATSPVEAAVLADPVTSITTTPSNPRLQDPVRTDLAWCVPDSATAGDTFQVALPPQLTQLPRSFNLRDPDGVLVATALIQGTPAVVTFTFNDYVDTHTGVCGTAFFESRLDNSLIPGNTYTLTYVVNSVTTFEPVITIRTGTTTAGRDTARKGGYFDDPNDDCRTVAVGCLGWYIETVLGPLQSVTVIDNATAGTTFACDQVSVLLWSVNSNGALLRAFQPSALGATVTVTCSPTELQVAGSDIPANRLMRVLIRATPDQLNPAGGVTFSNSATVTQVLPNESVVENNISGQRRSSLVGGDANGVIVPPTTTTTVAAPTTTVEAPTTTVVAALPPVPPTTIGAGPQLPATGTSYDGTLLAAGLFMLLAGASMVIATRGRRRTA
ncbi:MAG: Ig-like domain-containing protein [Ilumatobacteraceae bacterium]